MRLDCPARIEVPPLPAGDQRPAISGRAPLLAAVSAAAATLLVLQLGSGHTPASHRFAALPQFEVWVWVYAAEVGVAAALGIASFPAFLVLARATGRRATILAVAAWPVLGALLLSFGPTAVENPPLWLGTGRTIAINLLAGLFITPSFAGLLLIQPRLAGLASEAAAAVPDGTAGRLIVELAWLRAAMLRFLATFATAITAGLLALGALRDAALAEGTPAVQVPALRLLTYGGVLTAVAALIFVPAYAAWQGSAAEVRDALHPVPEDGRPARDWFQARDDLDGLLESRASAARVLATAFGVLAPLLASVVSALLSAGQ
jgi:hypothetical protein